jgi:hypothetical protein
LPFAAAAAVTALPFATIPIPPIVSPSPYV